MEEKKNEKSEWSQMASWFGEMIEQAKLNAKRWFVAWIITLIALIGTNAYWIYEFTAYEYVSQDGSGVNSINTGHQEDVSVGTEDEN